MKSPIIELHPKPVATYRIRQDVLAFAMLMSETMNQKDAEQIRPTTQFVEALQEIEGQMQRIKEQMEHGGGVSANFPVIYRRLVHIANLAMLAHGLVPQTK